MNIKAAIKNAFYRIVYGTIYPRKCFGAIGPHCIIGKQSALVPANMFLDDYVIVQNRVNFISSDGKLVVKKYSVISSQCVIVPGTHLAAPGIPFYFQALCHYGDEHRTIHIGEDCWVGAASILLSRCSLGRGCVVAAGSVVSREFPPYAVIGGMPAKIIGVKFSKEDILRHEAAIYPPEERMKPQEIDDLFAQHYSGFKPMRQCCDSELARFEAAGLLPTTKK